MAIDLWNKTSSLLGFLSEERRAGRDPALFDPGSPYDKRSIQSKKTELDDHLLFRIW